MAILNQEILKLTPDSLVGKLFKQLYDGMVEANKAQMPSTDGFIDEEGNIDEEGINSVVNEYSDILMQNSAYNTAKSIVDIIEENAEQDVSLYSYIRTSSSITDDVAIHNALNGLTPSDGNMVIIIDKKEDGSVEYGRTGFVYSNGIWKAFNGRIDAKNVIIRGNLTLAGEYVSIGNINKGSTLTTSELATDGLSVIDVFNKMFSCVIEPKVIQPFISSFVVKANSNSGLSSVEAGTKILPYWNVVFNTGTYTYNDSTEVSIESCIITNDNDDILGNHIEGTYDTQIQVADSDYKVKAILKYSDGIVPFTNMKELSTKVQAIKAGTLTKTGVISSYRKIFYGYSTATNINSSTIRLLTGKINSAMTLDFKENTDATQIIIAAPRGTRNVSKVIMPSSSNVDVTTEFIKQTTAIQVYGANNYTPIDYDVWIYKPAKMAGTYTITIV